MHVQSYPMRPPKARCTFYAVHGGRRILIRGATMKDVLARLRALCPGGNFRELWEGKV